MKKILITFPLIISSILAYSQYTIDFHSNIQNGCTPVIVAFINTSDYPNDASYLWDFGNGKTSVEKNPQTSYSAPGTFSVKLTVTYNETDNYIIKENYITVYEEPSIDFSYSDNFQGCVPFNVQFEPLSPSIESITNYNWSFGDGFISEKQSPEHAYDIQGQFSVTLIVEDNNGCIGSITKEDLIEAYQPKPKFGVDKSYSCNGKLDVTFNNLSESILDYSSYWKFGDNVTSTISSPNHTYTSKGLYNVSLIIVDSLGCSDSILFDNLIKVDKVIASFNSSKDTVCLNESFSLANTSSNADSYQWSFGDGTASTDFELNKKFNQYGDIPITLSAQLSDCISDTTKVINVEYVLANFSPLDTFLCRPEQYIDYQDQSINAIEWEWKFGTEETSSSQNPSILIPDSDILKEKFKINYSDTLIVTSKHGCKNKKVATNNVTVQIPDIVLPEEGLSGCAPLTIELSAETNYNTPKDEIKSYSWYVNNNIVSSNSNYEHIQNTIGRQEILFSVDTQLGCIHSKSITVSAGEKLTPSFTIEPNSSICASEYATLHGSVEEQDKKYSVFWDLGDNSEILPADIIYHTFEDTGFMDISFVVNNLGCESSITKSNAIYVKGPYVNMNIIKDCENPYSFLFEGEIKGAENYYWDFGDGSELEYNISDPSHNYSTSGDYILKIKAENNENACSFQTQRTVRARNLQANFKSITDKYCPNTPIVFDPSATIDNYTFKHNDITAKYLYLIEGKELMSDTTVTYQFKNKGIYDIGLVVQDINQCRDTLTKKIQIFKPEVQFESNYKLGCMPVIFSFTDKTISETSLTSWLWDFGDGSTSNLTSPDHEYNSFGNYNVSLTVVDDEGCSSFLEKEEDIQAIFPDASFIVDDSTSCLMQEITLMDNSNSDITSYKWYINEEFYSDLAKPFFVTTDTGFYNISLDIIDSHGCTAHKTKNEYIYVQKPPEVNFESSSTFSECYPFLVKFYDTSVTDYPGSWFWKFDDRSNKSILQNPSFIYSKPGNYDVTLISSTSYGCSDTLTVKDYIEVKGPYATPVIQDTICTNSSVYISAIDTVDIYEIAWDLGDGNLIYQNEFNYTYSNSGYKYPSIILKSDSIGTCNVIIRDTTYAIDFKSLPSLNLVPNSGCIPLNVNLQSNSTNIDSFKWILNDKAESFSQYYSFEQTEPGINTYQLIVNNTLYSCIDSSDVFSYEAFAPPVIQTSRDTLICKGDQIIISASGGVNYEWLPNTYLDNNNIGEPIAQPDSTTTYKVLVEDINQCTGIDSVLIKVQQIPEISLSDTTIIIGESVDIQIPNTGLNSVRWENMPGLACLDCFYNTLKPLESTSYIVWITDTNNCFSVDYNLPITVLKKYSVDVPTAFTPNGDGINDELYIKGWGLKQLIEFKVFNRFGEMIYQSNKLDKGWDGTYKGKPLANETYLYTIKVLTYNNEILSKSGEIKIIR